MLLIITYIFKIYHISDVKVAMVNVCIVFLYIFFYDLMITYDNTNTSCDSVPQQTHNVTTTFLKVVVRLWL